MAILVTGAAGFIGFHVAKRLLEQGKSVVGVDCFIPYYNVALKRDRLEILESYDNFSFAEFDLAESDTAQQFFAQHQFEVVIHLAAQAGVRYSLEYPFEYMHHNYQGFLSVLEAARKTPPKHLIFASTSSVYGGSTAMPFKEESCTDHQMSLYAASKKANEMMAHSYAHLYNIPMTGLRFFTVYGPWGRPDMALFKFVKGILADQPIDVYNNGEMHRDFTYVADVARAITVLCDKVPSRDSSWSSDAPTPNTSGIAPYRLLNIGNQNPVALKRFVEVIEQTLGKKAIIKNMPMQAGDVKATASDTSKLLALIGNDPFTSVEEGVASFVAWYQHYFEKVA